MTHICATRLHWVKCKHQVKNQIWKLIGVHLEGTTRTKFLYQTCLRRENWKIKFDPDVWIQPPPLLQVKHSQLHFDATHWPLRNVINIFECVIFKTFQWLISLSIYCQSCLTWISQGTVDDKISQWTSHCPKQWWLRAITPSLSHTELNRKIWQHLKLII